MPGRKHWNMVFLNPGSPNLKDLELYQFGNYIYVSKTTLTIVWGLANAYKKSDLFENALYFFNMAEFMIRADSKMADTTCNLQSILVRSNECREKLAVLENQTLLVEEQPEYSLSF